MNSHQGTAMDKPQALDAAVDGLARGCRMLPPGPATSHLLGALAAARARVDMLESTLQALRGMPLGPGERRDRCMVTRQLRAERIAERALEREAIAAMGAAARCPPADGPPVG